MMGLGWTDLVVLTSPPLSLPSSARALKRQLLLVVFVVSRVLRVDL